MSMKTIESPQVSQKRRRIQSLKIRIYRSSRVAIVINDMTKGASGRYICSKNILTIGCSNKKLKNILKKHIPAKIKTAHPAKR
jgi:hypothetical protein